MNKTQRIESDHPTVESIRALVIGGNRFGLAVAEGLTEDAESVTLVTDDPTVTGGDGIESIQRDITGMRDVKSIASEVDDVDLVVVVGADEQALLSGYLARLELDPSMVIAGLDDPTNDPAFQGTGIDRINVPALLAERIRERYDRVTHG